MKMCNWCSVGGCPFGTFPVNCLLSPCRFATCPAVEGATCVADYCGGCNARWLLNGQEVTSQCFSGGEHYYNTVPCHGTP